MPFPLMSAKMTSDNGNVDEDEVDNENNVMMTFHWFSDLP